MAGSTPIFSKCTKRAWCNLLIWVILVQILCGCHGTTRPVQEKPTGRTVEVVQVKGQYQLLRNGKPFFIKGAGGYTNFELLKLHGGNSIRVWDTNDATRVLDQAHALGLTVCLGIWMTREKEGFNYDDKQQVQRQFEQIKRDVLKYKDHPALLMWNIGNEISDSYTNIRVWDAMDEVARLIHEVDPNHPTSTTLMQINDFRVIRLIKQRCPNIDILGVNAYGELRGLPDKIRQSAWDGPYFIAEFGAEGYWETTMTSWEEPWEPHSSEKAAFIRSNYENNILADTARCLGSYIFHWGEKQEKTHTWFSLITRKGEKTEAVDIMQQLWTGNRPENSAPRITAITADGKDIKEDIVVQPNTTHSLRVSAWDPDNDTLLYDWEILPEVESRDGTVFREKKPRPVKGAIVSSSAGEVTWKAPAEAGAFRLFVTVSDGKKSVATANVPFLVAGPKPSGAQPLSSVSP